MARTELSFFCYPLEAVTGKCPCKTPQMALSTRCLADVQENYTGKLALSWALQQGAKCMRCNTL